jgi:hypothetical protein
MQLLHRPTGPLRLLPTRRASASAIRRLAVCAQAQEGGSNGGNSERNNYNVRKGKQFENTKRRRGRPVRFYWPGLLLSPCARRGLIAPTRRPWCWKERVACSAARSRSACIAPHRPARALYHSGVVVVACVGGRRQARLCGCCCAERMPGHVRPSAIQPCVCCVADRAGHVPAPNARAGADQHPAPVCAHACAGAPALPIRQPPARWQQGQADRAAD